MLPLPSMHKIFILFTTSTTRITTSSRLSQLEKKFDRVSAAVCVYVCLCFPFPPTNVNIPFVKRPYYYHLSFSNHDYIYNDYLNYCYPALDPAIYTVGIPIKCGIACFPPTDQLSCFAFGDKREEKAKTLWKEVFPGCFNKFCLIPASISYLLL